MTQSRSKKGHEALLEALAVARQAFVESLAAAGDGPGWYVDRRLWEAHGRFVETANKVAAAERADGASGAVINLIVRTNLRFENAALDEGVTIDEMAAAVAITDDRPGGRG